MLTVVINLIEKYAMGGKRLPLKADIAILLLFVFFACFQAWRDQYEKVRNVATAPTIQITMPPINVPPAQVTVTPPPSQPHAQDLTGFVEIANVNFITSKISKGSPISLNAGFIAKGTQPVHDVYSGQQLATINYDKLPDEKLERSAEEAFRNVFKLEMKEQKSKIIKERIKGQKLGIGNELMWRTVSAKPLTESEAEGIVSGRTRLYLLTWVVWKDSHNSKGELEVCHWLQAPPSFDLSKEGAVVWHACEWAP